MITKDIYNKAVLDSKKYGTGARMSNKTNLARDIERYIKQQLAEKDKENALLKTIIHNELKCIKIKTPDGEIDIDKIVKILRKEEEQQIRHQVCDEIRIRAKQNYKRGLYTITFADLDAIEKGE